ncbi:AsmA family protein [Candidatus Deferrimicrobium sp.]|uniref:AsmA family protein n=1 Tax=Candidatus Deferrimicrobium sp. TaxID=3060586 RepID=UPI003C4FD741
MANQRKIALFAAGGLFALFLLAAVALVLFVDVNALKPRLEEAASDALRMEVRIGGRLGIGFFPGFHATLEDVRIRNRGADVASAKAATLGIELLPLLHRELRIVKVGMKRPRISIEQDADGKFNFETPEREAGKETPGEPEGTRVSLVVRNISLTDGAFFYADRKTGEVLEAGDFTLEVSRLRFTGGKSPDLRGNLSFVAEFACKEFRKGSLAVSNLKLRVEGKDGRYAIRPVTAARLVHSGPGGKVTADRIALGIDNLAVGGEGKDDFLRRISFSGTAGAGEVRTENLVVTDLTSAVAGKDGVLDLDPVTMRLFGGKGSGFFRADLSGSVPRYRVRYSLSSFRIEEFFKELSPKGIAEGPMDLSATLSMRGKTANEMKRTADGEVSLRGENLTVIGVDLDRTFSRYEATQSFNLVDVGAFFIAGPFAPLVTKGYTFASLFRGSGGSSRIRALVSDWTVERGIARAKDVAMATNKHRVALTGSLDFVNERFDDVIMAVIDGKGCATVRQKIRGSFRKPVVEKVNVIQSVAGPVLKLFKQAGKLLGGKCEVVYAGSVAPPE